MCDTFCIKRADHIIFAKNSDRHPEEPQYLMYALDALTDYEDPRDIEFQQQYRSHNWDVLGEALSGYSHPYPALISTPSWLWGAEMGVNSHGVAIGNEAVFTKRDTPYREDGLLGMDILRLALHNTASAMEAVELIIDLITTYGQGGNGAYRGSMHYHNSFLITDGDSSYILETAGRQWAWKQVESSSISNIMTIAEDSEKSSHPGAFSELHQDRLYTYFSKGAVRLAHTRRAVLAIADTVPEVRSLCRSHITDTQHRGMNSLCIHSGPLIKSATTSSLIVDYDGAGHCYAWGTNAPYPCSALYAPFPLPQDERQLEELKRSAFPTTRREAITFSELARKSSVLIAEDKAGFADILRTCEASIDEKTLSWKDPIDNNAYETAEICYTEIQQAYEKYKHNRGGLS